MSSLLEKFKALHQSNELLLLPNVWDARSAIVFEECGYPAVGTSSAAVANALGLEDGENMCFQDYLFVIKRILSSVNIPLTVDLEMGYGENDDEIADNVCHLAALGVAGINIEDSFIDHEGRKLKDAALFANTIHHIKAKLKTKDLDLFINLRSDTHLLDVPNKQKETLHRLEIYNRSAADGIFLPCIADEKHIKDVVAHSKLPLNVMVIPNLPGLDTLHTLGVKRVSMGPFAFQKVYKGIAELSKAINASRNFSSVFQ
jgi:2-methylisocitrate lyase-like PEP mutase family enzyme